MRSGIAVGRPRQNCRFPMKDRENGRATLFAQRRGNGIDNRRRRVESGKGGCLHAFHQLPVLTLVSGPVTQDVVKFRNQGEQFTVGLCPAEYVGEFPERGKNRLDTSEPGVGGEYARFLRCGGALFLLQTEHQPDCLYIVPEMRLFIISHSLPTRLQPYLSARHRAARTPG